MGCFVFFYTWSMISDNQNGSITGHNKMNRSQVSYPCGLIENLRSNVLIYSYLQNVEESINYKLIVCISGSLKLHFYRQVLLEVHEMRIALTNR
ncbi:hypothetical protein HHI36_011608 [Cryptolaemus montrouzieri]|uniref:Uncharacterized protein n=1 Tax=Cryptolaemus montrouzieri TaxID=559131 RepID=A0ABD2MMK8_9CUCU